MAFAFPLYRCIEIHKAGKSFSGDGMKYEDPQMEAYWATLPEEVQALINASGIDICSLGMLTKLGDYYKNGGYSGTIP